MIERHHLSILRELARQGSLTAAATSLCLTQSALTHSIRKLEEQIGTDLWRREGRQLHPTAAGRELMDLATRVLPQFEDVETRLAHLARGLSGHLRIGMECHPCYRWLLKVVDPYLNAWPDVDIDVRQRFQFGGVEALLHYEIDLLVTPDPVTRAGLVFQPVFDYEQVLVVDSAHPYAQRAWIEPDDLSDQTLISYPVDTSRLDIFQLFLRPAGVSPRRHQTIETTDILLQMVACGRGVAALPRWLVEEYRAHLPLCAVRLGATGLAKQIHLGWRHSDTARSYLQGFISQARSIEAPAATAGDASGAT